MHKICAIFILLSPIFSHAQLTEKRIFLEKTMDLLARSTDTTINPTITWSDENSLALEGLILAWKTSANGNYFQSVQSYIDCFITKDGNIKTYNLQGHNLDDFTNGKILLSLYKVTLQNKYLEAASILWGKLKSKLTNNHQSSPISTISVRKTLQNKLFKQLPFYLEYAAMVQEDSSFNDVAQIFIQINNLAINKQTGLIAKNLDGNKSSSNKLDKTSQTSTILSRDYMKTLVDVLEYFPKNHPLKVKLINIFNKYAASVLKFQNKKNANWSNTLNPKMQKVNYQELAYNCELVYAYLKGTRNGYLPEKYNSFAQNRFKAIQSYFIQTKDGQTHLLSKIGVADLNNGSTEKKDDIQDLGIYLLVANEYEKSINYLPTKNTVLLDNYYNNEYQKWGPQSKKPFHYLWEEEDINGFSFFGEAWHSNGYNLATLRNKPTIKNLSTAQVYIIVDPDTQKETTNPNYLNEEDASTIKEWVKNGGKLLLFTNDTGNCDLIHTNILARKFGFEFNYNSENRVQGRQFEQGAIMIPSGNEIFKKTKKIYIKELSTIQILDSSKVREIVKFEKGNVMIAAKIGKGMVFAVGDPWLYNEYTNGLKLPADYQNFSAAKELVEWVSKQ